jgi:hypothetical protein
MSTGYWPCTALPLLPGRDAGAGRSKTCSCRTFVSLTPEFGFGGRSQKTAKNVNPASWRLQNGSARTPLSGSDAGRNGTPSLSFADEPAEVAALVEEDETEMGRDHAYGHVGEILEETGDRMQNASCAKGPLSMSMSALDCGRQLRSG